MRTNLATASSHTLLSSTSNTPLLPWRRQAGWRLPTALVLLLMSLACVATSVIGGAAGLSFERRVEYQRRIEQVYWKHRSATQTSGQPTPFAEAMPDAAIRAKVEETLRKSAALASVWQRPITTAQLQAEVARMAANSRQPELLRELWAALDNDPLAIAECLARPVLVERQLSAWFANDDRFHGELRARIAAELAAKAADLKSLSGKYVEQQFAKGAAASAGKNLVAPASGEHAAKMSDAQWQGMLEQLAFAFERGAETAPDAVTGVQKSQPAAATLEQLPLGRVSELKESATEFYVVSIVSRDDAQITLASVTWPKQSVDQWWQTVRNDFPATAPEVGAAQRYALPQITATAAAPADDKWLPAASPLSVRESHTAVWTGSEMIVWGGFFGISNYTNYLSIVAGRYNPATDSWSLSSTINAPGWRERHTAIWTGTEMIVWGGYGGDTGNTNTGARYNPATNTWTATSVTNAPAGRSRHSAVWTGSKMIVWGGITGDSISTSTNTGGIYDPVANSWTAVSTSNAPATRGFHTAVWSGSEMIIFGGYNGAANTVLNTGGRYNPQTNTWQATSTSGAPTPRFAHNAVWTGSRMIIWAGGDTLTANVHYNDGALYDPASNSWSAMTLANAPGPRYGATAVWTGTEMIVWGGDNGVRILGGGRYNPQTNTWQAVSLANGPESSVAHTAVWTGSEMIVWGGQESTRAADVNTGARYNPQSNSWVPVTNPQNGGARTEHPAVWTGAEMIVWGSYTEFSTPTNTGARYYPATDTWLPTSMANVPHQRYSPKAVWSGNQMIVWGGCQDPFCFTRLNDGGRYTPSTDTWQPTSLVNAAEARYYFTAIWSGSEMIVWGGCDAETCGPGGNSVRIGLTNGGRYNPQTDTWQPLSEVGTPSGRWAHTAVWSGSEMIVWGGEDGDNGPHNDGARYNPATNNWVPMTLQNAPTARNHATAVWTGSRMIVWGHSNSLLDQYLNSGGLYNPTTDTWTATSLTGAPTGRDGHTLVWTGAEMIVWGGCTGANCQHGNNDGARYNPTTNTWRPISLVEAPSARDEHSAVFTGSEMIVFGGESCARCEPVLDTGGRYGVAAPAVVTSAVSRKTHGGSLTYDLPLPLTGTPAIESRSGGANGSYQLVVTFNSNVTAGTPQAQVTAGSAQPGVVSVSGSTVTIPLTNVGNAQTLQVFLSGVNNGNGNTSVTIPVSFLAGDINGDGTVNAGDVLQARNRSGQPADATNYRADVNADGTVNSGDALVVRARSGTSLP